MRKRLEVGVLCAALAAIAGGGETTAAEEQQRSWGLELPVRFYNKAGQKLMLSERPTAFQLYLGPVPGYVSGSFRRLVTLPTEWEKSIPLELVKLAPAFSEAATQLRPDPRVVSSTLQIVPQDARFAMAGMSAWYRHYNPRPVTLRIRLTDSDTDHVLMLLYFDRPCRMTGTVVSPASETHGQTTNDYDVEVESAGWVWIVGRPVGPEHFVYTRAVASHPLLLIAPSDSKVWLKYRQGSEPTDRAAAGGS